MGSHLILRAEGHDETIVSLEELPLVLGRGREVGLTLASPLVSRQHCEVYRADGKICVRDLESLNGTFVGEERITDMELFTGDLLTVGAATFEVVLEGDDAASGVREEATDLDATAFEALDDDSAADVEADDVEAADAFDFEEVAEDAGAVDEPTVQVDRKPVDKSPAPASSPDDDDLDDFLSHFE